MFSYFRLYLLVAYYMLMVISTLYTEIGTNVHAKIKVLIK
jgi:hypothetical protein